MKPYTKVTENGETHTVEEWGKMAGIKVEAAMHRAMNGVPLSQKRYCRKHQNSKTYTVYDNRTDEPVMISGTAAKCADAMGVSIGTFYSYQSKKRKRWSITRDWEEDD